MSVPERGHDYRDDIAAELHSSLAKLSRQLRNIELPLGISPERLSALAAIEAHGPVSVTALAAMENVRPATMSRMISSLAEDGLVRRRGDKTDKRGVLVVATAKGRRMHLRANQQCQKQLAEALSTVEPEQLATLRALATVLEKLNSALGR